MSRLANGGLGGLIGLIGLSHHQVSRRPPSDLPSDLWGAVGG